MKQINLISFPRSGQHLTERFLKFYCNNKKIKFSYCEFYNHCKKFPCESNRLFQKNHDFDLSLPIDPESKYVVLYRSNMTEQLEAWFRYYLRESWGLIHENKEIDYKNIEKRNYLIKFINSKTDYYINFVKKWVYNNNKNIYKLEYNSLLKNKKLYADLLQHIFPESDRHNNTNIINIFNKNEKIEKQHKVNLDFN
jgi:hypothetical protein